MTIKGHNAKCSKCPATAHIAQAHFSRKHRDCPFKYNPNQKLSLEAQALLKEQRGAGTWLPL